MLAIRGVRQAGANISRFEFRKVIENFGLVRPIGEHPQHIIHGDSEATDGWLAAPLAWLDDYPVHLRHLRGSFISRDVLGCIILIRNATSNALLLTGDAELPISDRNSLSPLFNYLRDERPEDFLIGSFATRSFGIYQERPRLIRLRFSPTAADEAGSYIFHPSQTAVTAKDGSLSVSFRAGGLRELCWFLFSWGQDVAVEAPAEPRGMYRGMINDLAVQNEQALRH